MAARNCKNDQLMMAILITVVGLMGLLQAVNLAMGYNLKSQLRDEAVLVGEKQMGLLKAMRFDDVAASSSVKVDSRLRAGFTQFYTVKSESTKWSAPDQPDAKLLIVTVTWSTPVSASFGTFPPLTSPPQYITK